MTGKINCIMAIVAIFGLTVTALHEGIDGQLAWLAVAAIAGLGGLEGWSQLKEKPTQ